MGEYSATHIGKEAVLSFFETEAETPYFSLWVKSQKQTQYNGGDIDKAVEKLEHWLEIYEKENFDKIVILKLHAEKEKEYTNKSGVLSQIYFKIGETKPVIAGNDTSVYLINEINNLRAELNALKLKEQPDEEDEEEDEEDPAQKTINGVLGALEHPVIAGLLTKMFSNNQPVARNLAGTDTADQYVQMLFSKGVTLEHLRKLAEMPQAKIQMLLTML
jgi:hypothetical protein